MRSLPSPQPRSITFCAPSVRRVSTTRSKRASLTTHRPATDLGYLLHKNPGRPQSVSLAVGELQTIIGRITSVAYFEISYATEEPMFARVSDRFDSLDFGLSLVLDDATRFSFTWGAEFAQYGVSLCPGPVDFGDSSRQWSGKRRWAHLLDVPIVHARIGWEATNGGRSQVYPQEVRLAFENGGMVIIASSEKRGDNPCWESMDHISVFFDEQEYPGDWG